MIAIGCAGSCEMEATISPLVLKRLATVETVYSYTEQMLSLHLSEEHYMFLLASKLQVKASAERSHSPMGTRNCACWCVFLTGCAFH